MRLPPNLKYFIAFLLVCGLIVAGTLYLPGLIPDIGKILSWVMISGMALLIIAVIIKPMLGFLYARTDGLFAVYIDESQQGFHVFGYHLNSSSRYSSFSTRDIQHYYITIDKGRIFYNIVYSHRMEPVAGKSGRQGFDSFEKSVLPSTAFSKSIQKLSKRSKLDLKLGAFIDNADDHSFSFEMDGCIVHGKKYATALDEGIRITCIEKHSDRNRWELKI